MDRYLYARALALNGEGRRAAWILDRAGLLPGEEAGGPGTGIREKEEEEEDAAPSPPGPGTEPWLRIEATLLAAECLAALGDWDGALRLLEGVCCYPPLGHAPPSSSSSIPRQPISSGDDARIDLLAALVRPSSSSSSSSSRSPPPPGGSVQAAVAYARDPRSIHPISRLSALLSSVHDEGGNAPRAATYLRAALRIDPRNVQALDHGLARRVLGREEGLELVLGLRFGDGTGDGAGGGLGNTLRDLYLAKLGFVPSSAGGGGVGPGAGAEAGAGAGAGIGGGAPVRSPGASLLPHHTPNQSFLRGEGDGRTHSHGGGGGGGSVLHMNADESSIQMDESAVMALSTPAGERRAAGAAEEEAPATEAADGRPAGLLALDGINSSLARLTARPDLSGSSEVLALAASHSYARYDLPLALAYCHLLERSDPYCQTAAYVHISALASLGYKRPLFQLAHSLVDAGPKSARAWYAVGSYYYACGRYDLAQRHYCRAARLDPRSAECWIAFGCSFAACDESDQALASYRAASRLSPGDPYPLLYMGMEYVRTNHLSLAGHFLKSAWRVSGCGDPLVLSEIGVWHYRKGDWEEAAESLVAAVRMVAEMVLGRGAAGGAPSGAESGTHVDADADAGGDEDVENTPNTPHVQRPAEVRPPMSAVRFARDTTGYVDVSTFSTAGGGAPRPTPTADGAAPSQDRAHLLSDLDCIHLCRDPYWEPTIFNLGQAYRKIRMFKEASACFEKSLSVCPGRASSYSALAYTRHLWGDLDGAIEAYHQALGRRPDDPFCSEMLMRALNESLLESHSDPMLDVTNLSRDDDGSFLNQGSAGASVLSPRGKAASTAAAASFLSGQSSGAGHSSSYLPRGGSSTNHSSVLDSSNDVDMSG